MMNQSAAEWAIATVVRYGESVTVTNVDQLERRNIKSMELQGLMIEHTLIKPQKLHILSSSQEQ
jgi:hypothetical protein